MLGREGLLANIWIFGEMLYTTDLITITLKAALTCSTWVKFSYIAIWGSIGLWFVLFPIYATLGPMIGIAKMELSGMMPLMFGAPAFWYGILLVPLITNLRDFTWK